MLKLICDVKCGYENLYVAEKGAEFPLDFLSNASLFQVALGKVAPPNLPTERELFESYRTDPNRIIADYGLFPMIRSMISAEYAIKFFSIIKDAAHPFFPELFRIEEVKLALADAQPKQEEGIWAVVDDPAGQDESDEDYDDFDLPPAKHTA